MANAFPPGSNLAAYLRDSGGEEQDLSIAQQEAALRAWCTEHACVLTRVFSDTRSGTSTVGRTGFEDLIHYFAQHKRVPEVGILLWRYNRFARDLDDAQFFKAGLRRRGYSIYSLNDPIPEGPAGRILEFFTDWMADKFSEDLSVDVRRGQRQLLEQFGALGGTPPRGFIRVPVPLPTRRDGATHTVHRWAPDPALWETCRTAWRMRAAGATIRQVHAAAHLFSSLNSYSTFFRNRIYLGELHFSDQLVIPNYVEPLVDQPTWDAVQALNRVHAQNTAADQPRHARRMTGSYLLSGLLHCARCGSLMNGHLIKFKGDAERTYYICSRRHAKRDCDAPLVPAAQLEEQLLAYLAAGVLAPIALAAVRKERLARAAEFEQQAGAQRVELKARLAIVRRRLANVTEAIAEAGRLPDLMLKLRDLDAEQTTLQSQIAALATPPINLALSPSQVERYSKNLQTLLSHADISTRKTILSALLQRIDVDRNGRQVVCTIYTYDPPDDLIERVSRLSHDDLMTGLDPPCGIYAYVTPSPGSTTRTHKFTFETKRRS